MSSTCSNCDRPLRREREAGLCWLCDRVWERTVAQSDRLGYDAGSLADARLRELAEVRHIG